ncbi:MAG TPA: exonuclease domain-containing protein [Candidatus Scybalocola faecipullorum]|nr:exonuclease domain-containing protein [Candidatus Scybalocola faecipullorum]
MNYIAVDFEWNQNPYGKEAGNKRLPFEIIEIGAVKLDEHAKIIDRFDAVICPRVYKTLHWLTTEMTGFTEESLSKGVPFDQAALDFLLWCGEDYMLCTWGNLDLLEFQRNLKYYKILDLLEGPVTYLNLQKIFKKFYSREHAVCALETAVDFFGIKKDKVFHRAIDDAVYTAQIFEKMDRKKVLDNYTVDYYQYPTLRKDEIQLYYSDYSKYISRGFRTKEAAMGDKKVIQVCCYRCRQEAERKVDWFASKTRNHYCIAYCPIHGYLRAKIKLKKTDDNKVIAIKTVRPAGEEVIRKILEIKKDVTQKRRERRSHGDKESGDL